MVSLGLGFVIGPAGSGKTRYIVDRTVERLLHGGPPAARPAVILLVPDQSTFQMERLILRDPRLEGFIDLHILSFRRLCLRVMEETGGLRLPFITAVGKSMAIQSILWEHRSELTVFAPMVNYPGFRATLSHTLSEMTAYGVTPASLSGLAGDRTVPFLDGKVRDLTLVFDRYREELAGRFSDPDDYFNLASERMPASSLVRGAQVYVDGFSGFTPAEYRALGSILATASQVTVALCADGEEMRRPVNPARLFHPTREAYEKIRSLARSRGIPVTDAVYLHADDAAPVRRFAGAPELAALERRLRMGPRSPSPVALAPGPDGPSVRLISATNPLAELEFVAREIQRLVRDCGLRFRDITVEARDLSGYAGMLPLVFGDHNIPFFFDQKRSLSHHPLSELIRAALDVVLTNWSVDAVMRYLKTDLVPVERAEVDILENYVLSHGIVGEKWISPDRWRYARKYLAREDEVAELEEEALVADGIRRRAVEALGRFYGALKPLRTGTVTAEQVSGAVRNLLEELDVAGRLASWKSLAEQAGDLAEGVGHGAVAGRVAEILDQAREVLKRQEADLKTYSLLLAAGLEDIRLGTIPPSLDQVLVGSVDRSRQPECQVTFLIGALLGVFPKKQAEDSIFTDAEREFLDRNGVDLEPASLQRQFHEQYLTYIALTRPSRGLYISYPLGDQEGKALTPSHVVNMVREALPGIAVETVSIDPPGDAARDLDFVVPARAGGITLRRLSLLRDGRSPGEVWTETYRHMLAPDRLHSTTRILGSLAFTNAIAPLDRSLVHSLYGRTLHTSVSRLETFAECPFRHFARDGLALREREIFRLEPADSGVFLHAALRRFVEEVNGRGLDWAALTLREAERAVDTVVDGLSRELSGELFASSARYRFISLALRRILRRTGGAMLGHFQRGSFRPVATEVLFGVEGGPKPMRLELPGKEEMLLRGQIDRIDAAPGPGGPLVRVVDYKSSPRSLDLLDVYSGMALQLLVYLAVVTESWDEIQIGIPEAPGASLSGVVEPAGALYFWLGDPFVVAAGPLPPEEAAKERLKRLRMSGMVVKDKDIVRMMDRDGTGHSEIIPVQFVAGGELGSRSSAAAKQDLAALLRFVRAKATEMSSRIFSGRVDIEPFRRGSSRACQYCPYGPLCAFDVLVPGNRYNMIRPVPQEELWREFRGHGTGGTTGG